MNVKRDDGRNARSRSPVNKLLINVELFLDFTAAESVKFKLSLTADCEFQSQPI